MRDLKAVQIYVGPAAECLFIKIIKSSSTEKKTLKNTHESGVMKFFPSSILGCMEFSIHAVNIGSHLDFNPNDSQHDFPIKCLLH